MRLAAALVLLLAACGGSRKPDDCQGLVDRSRAVLDQAAGSDAAGSARADRPELVRFRDRCKAGTGSADEDQARVECVRAAANDDAVALCWGVILP